MQKGRKNPAFFGLRFFSILASVYLNCAERSPCIYLNAVVSLSVGNGILHLAESDIAFHLYRHIGRRAYNGSGK